MREARKAIHPKLSPDPLVRMRARLDELDVKIANLRRLSQRGGDALAGTLAKTLEIERAGLRTKLRGGQMAAAI
jgi:hypothetical protein